MTRTITYRDALNEATAEEMRSDPSVFIYGIDVGDHKRIFNSTKGLVEEFGPTRCFSTPLSEDAMTGFGLGAAINGMRPIHVHMRVDFLLLGMNQLVNMIATHCYGSGGTMKVPMVIRAIIGRGWGQSYQHSKSLHSWFAHVPGLKVVMPATPRDAKGMLKAASVYAECAKELAAPIDRIGYEATPCPCTRPLENEFYPNAVDIIRAVERQLALSETDLSGEDFYSYENKFKGPF